MCEATTGAKSQSVLAGVTRCLGRLMSVQGGGCGSTVPSVPKAAVSSQLINCCLQSGKLRVPVTGMLNIEWSKLASLEQMFLYKASPSRVLFPLLSSCSCLATSFSISASGEMGAKRKCRGSLTNKLWVTYNKSVPLSWKLFYFMTSKSPFF